MAARVRHADANEKCGEWLRQGRPKLSPVRSAQQSKTEIEQIPDKLEFGLVFLLLFCSLMFFFSFSLSSHFVCAASEIFSHFSYCCFCRFVVFFLFLQHFHARFRLKYSLAIMIISTLRFAPALLPCPLKNDTLQQL